ncbi:protein ABHD16A [Ceratina calcarata]|uniref:Protein ABHD16A n=1 Tax=Ceratina calcarata TaxID=156304 RepID=A0AAJ7JI63_9HYME|nr:protein ABHD16A [Ceratina calcarata]
MSFILTLWRCNFGPRLFNAYEVLQNGHLIAKPYEANILERLSDQIVICFAAIWSISPYTIPLVAILFYHQTYTYVTENVGSLSNLIARISAVFVMSFAARGYSRATNPVYVKFLTTLTEANARYDAETRQELEKYHFEFWAKPVDFNANQSEVERDTTRERLTLETISQSSGRVKRLAGKEFMFALPCKFLSYIVAHTFAIKMIYPGSVFVLNWALLRSTLLQGRIQKKLKYNGERYKLLTVDNNEIDAMFIDQRQRLRNGNTLVITCEGNFGFYEIGIVQTPLSKGYSILGWNHPGFGSSTGAPYPSQEENAVDCVMRFAIERLKFPEERIIIYGWSIGGYTATWAAMNYPSIQSLILDATFDDVLPLAIMTMPPWLEGLVRNIIRDYFNLNIAEQLNRYNGTVLLIRRTEDEIVCTPNVNRLSGNRGNVLLTKLLMRRYPHLFTGAPKNLKLLERFLSYDINSIASPNSPYFSFDMVTVDRNVCSKLVEFEVRKNGGAVIYPSALGEDWDSDKKQQLILFLVTQYMKDQQTSHCMSLEPDLFQPGWNPYLTTE